MNDFRTRAREIKAAGEAERGNFEPNGVPLRVYNYWLNNSKGNKAALIKSGSRRENFCHFWRVVAIWAPLLFLFNGAVKALSNRAVQGGIALAVIALAGWAVTSLNGWDDLLLGLLGATALILGVGLVVLAGVGIQRIWRKSWTSALKTVFPYFMCVVVVGYVVVALVLGIMDVGWILLAYIAVAIAALALLVLILSKVSNFISGRRALARARRDAEREAEYERIARMTMEEYDEYMRKSRTPPEPGRISKFFSGLADFLILASQIVRVKKWKICPMVTIDTPVQ